MRNPDDAAPDWRAAARRGQLTMTVYSLAGAERDGVPIHPKAELMTVILPDGGDPFAMAFQSAERLTEFVADMAPRTVEVKVGPMEDEVPLRAMLARVHGAFALH